MTSCDKDEIDASATLDLSTPRLSFDILGGEQSVTITTDAAWSITIEDDATWLTTATLSGTGASEVTFEAERNDEAEQRTTKVLISAGGATNKELLVSQAGTDAPLSIISINPGEHTFPAVGGEKKMALYCDREWRLAPYDQDEQWFTVAPDQAEGNADVTITVARNTEMEPRSIELVFTTIDQSDSRTFTLKQEAFDYSDDITFDAGKTDITYCGKKYKSDVNVWDFKLCDKDYVESESLKGYKMEFSLITDESYDDNLPVGTFKVNTTIVDSEFESGDMAHSAYANPRDYYMLTPLSEGSITVESAGGSSYTLSGTFTAEDGVELSLEYTLDIASEECTIDDDSYDSDLDGKSMTQKITEVTLVNNGDPYMRGVNVWDMNVWADGAERGYDNENATGEGSHTIIRFYTPSNQSNPCGTYPVAAHAFDYTANTVEPGYAINYGEVNGTWINLYEDGIITRNAPAVEGEMTLEKNSDGTYTLSYTFKDDSPEDIQSSFSGDYTGSMEIFDRLDTGDFDVSRTMLSFVGDKYCDNSSWVLHVESKEFVESNGENGLVMEYILNVEAGDQFDYQINACEWQFAEGSSDDYVMYGGEVTTYTDGVASTSKVTGGKITNSWADNNNYIYRLDFVDITTADNMTYNMYHYCNMPREDLTTSAMESVDISKFEVANLTYFGENTMLGYNNWSVMLINSNGAIFSILDLFISNKTSFVDGIPSGTYDYIAGNDSYGVWDTNNTRVTYFSEFAGIESGSLTIENLGDGKYTFTADFDLDTNDTRLTGSVTLDATHIDNTVTVD